MEYQLQTTNLELSADETKLLDEKLDRISSHLSDPYTVHVRLMRDNHHNKGDVFTCIVNVRMGKNSFHAERTAETVLNAIDNSLESLKQELTKYHDRQKSHRV